MGDGTDGREVVVRRAAIGEAHVRDAGWRLEDGEVLLAVERFSLTSNNVTYAVLGEPFEYWRFYAPTEEQLGVVPVWGHAAVVGSRHAEVPVGERLYGFLPMATHAVLRPGRVGEGAVVDASPHRAGLAAAYQSYQRLAVDPVHDEATADLRALYWPLFATSFLLDDLVTDADEIGATTRTVVVTSASSKTALALAFLLARRGDVHVVGLTSRSNVATVADTGVVDEVVAYEDAGTLDVVGPAVLVDVAGRASVVEAVHAAVGDDLAASLVVGVTHQDEARAAPTAGPAPTTFFAPSRMATRAQDWGRDGLGERLGRAWGPFVTWVAEQVTVREVVGLDSVPDEWAALVAGDVDTGEGIVVRP